MCEIRREIYFPEIEVYDENWLKYALLYKEGITSMIPEYQEEHLSGKHSHIQKETNFFDYFSDFEHFRNVNNNFKGLILSLDEMRIPLTFDQRYLSLHDCFLRQEKDVELLNGKMTNSLEEDLVKKGYGVKINDRFFVSRNLATLYMGMMAESIARTRGMKVASTQARYKEYQGMLRNLNSFGYREEEGIVIQNQEFKEFIIDQSLPLNINQITIPMIIRLRNKGKYHKELTAYNELLLKIDDYIKNENAVLDKSELINELTSRRSKLNTFIRSEFGSEIFSYAVSAMIPTQPNPIIDVGTSYMITKSVPHVRKLLRLPNIDVTQREIKSVTYMQTSWENIDI